MAVKFLAPYVQSASYYPACRKQGLDHKKHIVGAFKLRNNNDFCLVHKQIFLLYRCTCFDTTNLD